MPQQPPFNFNAVCQTLITYRWRWIVPTVLITTLALGYALVRTAKWQATQALLVRDEANGSRSRPGQFDDPQLMKTAQETVLELVKSRGVANVALTKVGRIANPSYQPSSKEVNKLREAISVSAPNGSEFGRTEVFYIKVSHKDREKAMTLTDAVCDALDERLRELRDHKAQSLIDELTKTAEMVRSDLNEATRQLADKERAVGSDLAELRILNESSSGESNLTQTLIDVKSELRQARMAQKTSEQLLEILKKAEDDPNKLISTPNRLLEAQPALRQLKDGLMAAKLLTAQLLGELSSVHPKVMSTVASQEEIRRHIHNELPSSTASIQAELKLGATLMNDLQEQVNEITVRITRLAEVRAEYGNLVTEVERRTMILSEAQKNLSDARASQIAAHSASVMTLLDGPSIGDSPVGPSRSMIALCGLFGGLMTGLGIVFLTVPTTDPQPSPALLTESNEPREIVEQNEVNNPSHGLSLKEALSRISQFLPSWN